MTTFLLYCPLLVTLVLLPIGIYIGKRSRNIDLTGLGSKEAFAYFLLHEIWRHQKDIDSAKADLAKLLRAGVKPPNLPLGLWIEVKK